LIVRFKRKGKREEDSGRGNSFEAWMDFARESERHGRFEAERSGVFMTSGVGEGVCEGEYGELSGYGAQRGRRSSDSSPQWAIMKSEAVFTYNESLEM
jgi:hypothetical protein